MLSSKALNDWLAVRVNVDRTDFYEGPNLPDALGRHVITTVSGGAGLTTEMLFDQPAFQLRTTGEQGSYDDAESFAWQLDYAMLTAPVPFTLGTERIILVSREGGGPSVLATEDDADRSVLVATYIVELATGL